MLVRFVNFLMVMMVTTGVFMLTRYVFLEPAMEEKKQRVYYAVSLALIIFSFFFIEEACVVIMLALGGLNIALCRKRRRLTGFLIILPLTGLVNGMFSPFVLLEILGNHEDWQQMVALGMYAVIAVLLLIFYFKGKEWRRWFATKMVNRRLLSSEYIIVVVSGMLFLGGSATLQFIDIQSLPREIAEWVKQVLIYYEMTACLSTITIVVLILQGNLRKFYHDGLSNMQFSVIATMADIVENRDSNTGGHIKRTAKYVEIIGRKLRRQNAFREILTEDYLTDMTVAAPLHDIGKVCIPDAILNKPGKLTPEEFAVMKTHASAGRDVLLKAEKQMGEFDYLQQALDMAQYHHEWWNGSGYPTGVKGEDIPLCARIMAVADVFDALTSRRCYKEPMSVDKAYRIIREESGTHFDPAVAEAFLISANEVEQAMREISEAEE